MFLFLTVVQAIIGAALVAVILMQRSEGGGLGIGGGSPGGLMSARGAADFMTRATAILATLFVLLSITLAVLAVGSTGGGEIDTSLDRSVTEKAPANPLGAQEGGAPAPAAPAAPAQDPLAGGQ
ncbi:MAG: preprotein translocase subunit SecG [Novosphingobium sp.]|nr:preprotein translocase subunit SecG [Novosphingobium sp.]